MKPPICKVCKSPHWTYEGHTITETSVPEYVREMAKGAIGGQESPRPAASSEEGSGDAEGAARAQQAQEATPIKRTEPLNGQNKRTRGRPRKWASEAERKRAYRERSRG